MYVTHFNVQDAFFPCRTRTVDAAQFLINKLTDEINFFDNLLLVLGQSQPDKISPNQQKKAFSLKGQKKILNTTDLSFPGDDIIEIRSQLLTPQPNKWQYHDIC